MKISLTNYKTNLFMALEISALINYNVILWLPILNYGHCFMLLGTLFFLVVDCNFYGRSSNLYVIGPDPFKTYKKK